MEQKAIEGWPLTDAYPYRNQDKLPACHTEKIDCDFVKQHRTAIKDEEADEHEYYLDLAWEKINELQEELQEAKIRIKWLENVGGETLKMACGVDIMCREMAM